MLKKLGIRQKILLAPVLLFVFLLLQMGYFHRWIKGNVAHLQTQREHARVITGLREMAHRFDLLHGAMIQSMVNPHETHEKTFAAHYDALKAQYASLSPENLDPEGVIIQSLDAYYAFGVDWMRQKDRSVEWAEAMRRLNSLYQRVQGRIFASMEGEIRSLHTELDQTVARHQQMIWKVILTPFLILAVIIILVVLIWSQLIHTVDLITQSIAGMASGDLTVEIPDIQSRDAFGHLVQKMREMVNNLRDLSTQIKETATSLAAASSEISASVTQIASGATETATAANETSTTVEEVRQTALDSSRKAKYVSESAQKAVQISQNGEKSVAMMVEGMKRIESQMTTIAESILKLSEHGQAIGGIIATVEDVAEQSNLLAVNASIEAAKAGEHGKGFAVVAMEVKNLAEQSRQATARIRGILDDIQKATTEAVMVTEQGTRVVESGVEVAANASDAIQKLAASIAEAAQATTQIAVSSQEQLVGMDQVVSAMESIKQASTQNMTATKQVESAAHDLHELGQNLKHLVEQYRV